MKFERLDTMAQIEISGVDKKTKQNEIPIKLCNFVDVYRHWAITSDNYDEFMDATAKKDEINTFKLKKGQVAITKDSETRDDIGISTYIADSFDDVILGYHTALITPDETKLDGAYLNAYMHSKASLKHFENNASGSGQRYTLSDESIKSLKILLPETIEEQKRISGVLSDIDKKITINNKIANELLKTAKDVYEYWFLQFNFPNKEDNPYKDSKGELYWNDDLKRNIPIGWESGFIGDLFETQSGYAFKSSEWKETGHPVLTIKNIEEYGYINTEKASYISSDYNPNFNKYGVKNGNLIFAMSGNTIGKVGLIASDIDNVLINQRVLIIKTNTSNLAYSYFLLMDKKTKNKVIQLGANSAQPNISEDAFRGIKILLPPKNILDKYNNYFQDFFEKIIKIRIENQNLCKLHNCLLPLLMNGQVTVK